MKMRGFIGGSNVSVSPFADQERTMNLYVAPTQSTTAPSQMALYQRPGVRGLDNGSVGAGRGAYGQDNLHAVVIGSKFYLANNLGVLSLKGDPVDDGNPATISSSGYTGDQLFITSANQGYVYQISTGVWTIIAFLANKARVGAYMDGFFLAMDTSASVVYVSDLLDGLTWDPTNFIQRTQASDPWISMIVANKYLYLIGTQTTEPWYNAGTSPIAFAPVPSTLIQYGSPSCFSATIVGNSVMFLAQSSNGSGSVVNISGVSAETVETAAVSHALEAITSQSDAIGFSYSINGHTFYCVTFRSANQTWVYDQTTNIWTEAGNFHSGTYGLWRVCYTVPVFGEVRCLDLLGTQICVLSDAYFVDPGGDAIRWERVTPAQFKENKRIVFRSVELFTESGLADLYGQGSNPQVMMQMSNDGGKTYGSEVWAGCGLRGQYGYRTRWDRLGMARNKTFKFAGTDPIPWRIVDCFMEIEQTADFQ